MTGTITASVSLPHDNYTLADTSLGRLGFLSATERDVLSRELLLHRSLMPKDELIWEGGSPSHIFFLIKGWAYRYMTTPDGARQIPALLVTGSVCNLDSLLSERIDFGVSALTEATVLALPRSRAMTLASQHPGIARAFTFLALSENAILNQWVVGLGRRGALARLAHLLCELCIRVDANGTGENAVELPLAQVLIADVLGLTPVHVNRMFRELRDGGYISTAERKMTVLDLNRLCTLAEFDPAYLHQIERNAAAAVEAVL